MSSGFNKYFQDELSYLREMGREFCEAYPEAAPFLAERGSDPDVERLLEGFAFLSGRIRQKLDDELPEITHSMMQLLWPHYLRPIPAMSILRLETPTQASEEAPVVPRGTEVDSVPVDGTPCRFRTVYDVQLHPLAADSTELKTTAPATLRLRLRVVGGADLSKVPVPSLRLFIHADPAPARTLYMLMLHQTERIVVRPADSADAARTITLDPGAASPSGFGRDESLLPLSPISFEGFRLLHEYFSFPQKFLFVDLDFQGQLPRLGQTKMVDIIFELKDLAEELPALGTGELAIHCTPIANVFQHDADPFRVDPGRTEYRVRPSGKNDEHYEVYDVERVTGLPKGARQRREYTRFLSFQHSIAGADEESAYFKTRLESSLKGEGTDTFLSLTVTGPGGEIPELETVTMGLLCTNGPLPSRLKTGDIRIPTSSTPGYAKFKNITSTSPSVPPPLGEDVYWRLLSHLSLNYVPLHSLDGLRSIVGLYNFRAVFDRQAAKTHRLLLDGIQRVETNPATRLFQGSALRGMAIEVDLEEDNFSGTGDVFLFATMLNEFFALYATLNSFTELTVKELKHGEVYRWPARIGGTTIR